MVRYIPLSEEERNYMNSTGKTPESVYRKSDGCMVLTPEQADLMKKEQEAEQERLMKESDERVIKDLEWFIFCLAFSFGLDHKS